MSRRGSGAVQREWVRCSSASPVVLNNAARVEEKRPTSSLNGRHRLGVAVSWRLILAHLTGESQTPDRRCGEGQQGARVAGTRGTVVRPSRWGSLSGEGGRTRPRCWVERRRLSFQQSICHCRPTAYLKMNRGIKTASRFIAELLIANASNMNHFKPIKWLFCYIPAHMMPLRCFCWI